MVVHSRLAKSHVAENFVDQGYSLKFIVVVGGSFSLKALELFVGLFGFVFPHQPQTQIVLSLETLLHETVLFEIFHFRLDLGQYLF